MQYDNSAFKAGLIYSLLSATCFGFLAIFFRLGYQENLDTGTMLTLRFFSAFVLLTPYIYAAKRKHITLPLRAVLLAAVCGIFLYGVQSYCFAASIKYISASTAGLILYLYPLVVMMMAAVIFKNRITVGKILSILLILAGCLLVFYDAFSRMMHPTGLMLATAAMIAFSFYFIFLQKTLIDIDSTVFSYYVIGFTALQCALVYHPNDIFSLSVKQWSICLLLGIIPTVFAIMLLYKAIERIGSSYSAIFSSLEPAVTIVASAFLLDEQIEALQIGGVFFIIGGIVLPNLNTLMKKSRLPAQY